MKLTLGKSRKTFHGGEVVRESGIYVVRHNGGHRPGHQIALVAKGQFPLCDGCGDMLCFEMLHSAPHIFEDSDFAELEEPESVRAMQFGAGGL